MRDGGKERWVGDRSSGFPVSDRGFRYVEGVCKGWPGVSGVDAAEFQVHGVIRPYGRGDKGDRDFKRVC